MDRRRGRVGLAPALAAAALGAVVLFVAAAPAGPVRAAAEPYRLGVALGLTGTGRTYSQDGLRGIGIAVEEINAEGGLLGEHPIELHVGNTRTSPEVAEEVARDLIDEGVRAVIGTYSSASALAIKPILRDARVLHIATISNAEDITLLDPSPYTFSVVPNTYMMAKAAALGTAKLAKEEGWDRYATIASDYVWGHSSQELQVAILKDLVPGLELAAAYWPPLGETLFTSYVVAVARAAPDFVLASLAGEDNEYWLRDAHDYGLFKEVAAPGTLISLTELIRDVGWVERGAWGRTRAPFFAHLDEPMMAAFVARYREKYDGAYPSDWAVLSYDGVMALKQGVERAGTVDGDAVKDALKGATIHTTRGELFFREVDNQLSAPAYFGRIADDPAYPFPIYADLTVFPGPDIWRPEAEILAARGGAAPRGRSRRRPATTTRPRPGSPAPRRASRRCAARRRAWPARRRA